MKGALCLVLHGHMPWVLHHGRWPHGEDWLFEALSETWLPLLAVLDQCAAEGIRPGWSVGLTPVLLEQLAQPSARRGFSRWLEDARRQAERDERQFHTWGGVQETYLAHRWREHLEAQDADFDERGGDVVGALRSHAEAGRIELLSSNATHAYHPLLLHDACARAQLRAGLASSARHLGHRPAGAWLPECAYHPGGPWVPPVLHHDERQRAGVAGLFAAEGVGYFVVEDPAITGAPADALSPRRLVESGVETGVTVAFRCMEVARRVWSAEQGYPGDPRYLEFHKRHGLRGLRYWQVTDRHADLGAKTPYDPEAAAEAVAGHAGHFANLVRERLRGHAEQTGAPGLLCTPFDAELFGHWWHEGPAFLLHLARALHRDPEVAAVPLGEALAQRPDAPALQLPEGSWGAGGDHRVWLNEDTRAVWTEVYRAEDRFLDLWHRAPWRADPSLRRLLREAARQLLLLQASDWPFVIATGGAVDYGRKRVYDHAQRFDALCLGVEDRLAGHPSPAADAVLAACQVLDPVFVDLDLSWWS